MSRIGKGDIPDWIAWDDEASGYLLGEAKGNLSTPESHFIHPQVPQCVANGKAQFGRVQITDPLGNKLTSSNWVVANSWATDSKSSQPHILLWDPPADGGALDGDEAPQHQASIAKAWMRSITGVFRPLDLLDDPTGQISSTALPSFRVKMSPELGARELIDFNGFRVLSDRVDFGPEDTDATDTDVHVGDYILALIDPFGVVAIREDQDAVRVDRARMLPQPTPRLAIGINVKALAAPGTALKPWLGSAGIATEEGIAVFDLNEVEIDRN